MLGWLVAAYIDILIRTIRWRFHNRPEVDSAMAAGEGLIAAFWHGRIAQGMACRPLLADKPRRVMISLSPDGAFMALAAERLGIPPIRGSTGRADGATSKHGAAAYRQALRFVRAGGVMIVTPDGPRGPREVLATGPVLMARDAGCPVFLMSLAARPAIVLKSWDAGQIPLPFARGHVVLEGPLRIGRDADVAAIELVRQDWERLLRAGQARAEAMLGKGRAR